MKSSKTIKDSYKYYVSQYGKDLEYSVYRKICVSFNKKISGYIVEKASEFKMPSRLGVIRIKKLKSNSTKKVDWKASKENDCLVYHLNFHTDENYYKWFWHKKGALFTNKNAYSFAPIRGNKRMLAKLLKENKVEFFE
jgi:hypothetical protein